MSTTRQGHRYIDCRSGQTIDCWFPRADTLNDIDLDNARSCPAVEAGILRGEAVTVESGDFAEPATTTEQASLRLHLLSECQVQPNKINLEGVFSLLPNLAWTSGGPVLPADVDRLRAAMAKKHLHLMVTSIDRFPRMTDYVIPEGVRIGDADRVRLGAHLSAGTTVMHEGFVNFNAGTLGDSMVEGRVTPGVVVGKNSDVGAGASIMGTLSGGGKQVNSIGEHSLLGANAGIGISLGDHCIVEAGLYVTAGTKVKLPDGNVVAARQLSGENGLLFRRNSQTGVVEAIPTSGTTWGGLNASLHSND